MLKEFQVEYKDDYIFTFFGDQNISITKYSSTLHLNPFLNNSIIFRASGHYESNIDSVVYCRME